MNQKTEALDPNTPPTLLLALLQTHAAQVLRNPAFALMLVAQPDLWAEVPWSVQLELLQLPACPDGLALWATQQERPDVAVLLQITQTERLPASLRRAAFLRLPPFEDFYFQDAQPLTKALIPLDDFLPADELALFRRAGLNGPRDDSMTAAEVERLATLGGTGRRLASQLSAGAKNA